MELNGVVLRQPTICFSSSRYTCSSSSSYSKQLQFSSSSASVTGFYDQANLQYYYGNRSYSSSIVRSEKHEQVLKKMNKTKKKKKRMKLMKGVCRDLSDLCEMNFGLKSDGDLLDQVKGNIISDAAERLVEQLQKLRAEEKELKRKKKEEKTRLKAVQMQNRLINCEICSSSSSESSSDSDNEEVIDTNSSLKRAQTNQNATRPVIDEGMSRPTSALRAEEITEERGGEIMPSINSENGCCSGTGSSDTNLGKVCDHSINSSETSICSKKIEVCMGGKCKKSGATALLERFQRVVGIEGAVSGCKCMGKCRTGPNVRILNSFDGESNNDSVRSPRNPLCTGVGLEDVDIIVANFIGENQNRLGFAT